MAKWAFLNDQFLEEEQAAIHFRDLAFQRGYGIFDFFRLAGNNPVFLDDHLNRFRYSAANMHLEVPLPPEQLQVVLLELLQRNNLPDTGIRLSLTGGYSEDGFTPAKPNLVISQHSFAPPSIEQHQTGIKLFTYHYQRQLPHVKSIDYLMAVWLQPLRKQKGADDILYHQDGIISECPRSNFFLVVADNKIVTPAQNVLAGITRKKVIEIARNHYEVEERDVMLEEIRSAQEAFITSTTKQLLRVRQIDDVVFTGNDVTSHLLKMFQQLYPI
jgi:D-alanine transaminase/branched-chain amino acid aminotransferase